MIFITYWELNPDFDPTELVDMAQTMISKKLYPMEGVKQIAWYVSPDYWGISVEDAVSEEAIVKNVSMWRIAKPGVFKIIKTSPAMKVESVLPIVMKLSKQIKE